MAAKSIKVVFGTAGEFFTKETAAEVYDVLRENDVHTLDTAQLYEGKEEIIGLTEGAKRFTIDSKEMGGFRPKTATRDKVVQRGKDSLAKIGTAQV